MGFYEGEVDDGSGEVGKAGKAGKVTTGVLALSNEPLP